MSSSSAEKIDAASRSGRVLEKRVLVGAVLFVILVLAAAIWLTLRLRDRTVANETQQLQNLALVLAQETDRTFQTLEAVQNGLIERMQAEQIDTPDKFVKAMSSFDVYRTLHDKSSTLPYVDAITLINREGRLINFSRYWPIPEVNVSDRDYFQALSADPALRTYLSVPVLNRGSGTWTLYLAHKYAAPDGRLIGLVLGAIRLDYIERFYSSIDLGRSSAIGLFRDDGTLLLRQPRIAVTIGKRYTSVDLPAMGETSKTGVVLQGRSAVDGSERLITRRHLEHYPVSISVSVTAAALNAMWRGEAVTIWVTALLLCAVTAACAMLGVRQLRAQRRFSARAGHMARHDALTGLPNRVAFYERAREGLRRAPPGGGLAVLLLDLDYFKTVNDTLGHPIGDQLLQHIAKRLLAAVPDPKLVTRLGGDEFAVLESFDEWPGQVLARAQQLIEAVALPCEIGLHRVRASASIGIARSPEDGDSADELLQHADLALYQVKAEGRGIARSFEPAMATRAKARHALEVDLRAALKAEQLVLYFQPFFEAASRRVCGFEALVRWNHPQRGLVAPGDFIPVAEETGLIVEIGEYVLRRACIEASYWPASLRVAVNVAAAQFRGGDLLAGVNAALAASGLSPQRLEIEITETTLVSEHVRARQVLSELRTLGVTIALDDFGTGYSSLSYLRQFPADRIKIDRSFVDDIAKDAASLRLVRAIISMALSLGTRTTAEGVETDEQLALLRAAGCDTLQGFLLGRPMPAVQVAAWLCNAKLEPQTLTPEDPVQPQTS